MSFTIISILRYRDASAAIEYLQNVLGFEATLVVDGEGGLVEHAQLRHGNGMIMVSSIKDNEYQKAVDALWRTENRLLEINDLTAPR